MRIKRFWWVLFCPFTAVLAQLSEIPNSQAIKLSPGTSLFLQHSDDVLLFPKANDGMVACLVQAKGDVKSTSINIKVIANYGEIWSLRANKQGIRELMQMEGVEYIDLAWRLNSARKLNDTTRILSKVNEVHSGLSNGLPSNYLGTDVVVGIVDIGFQPENPTFYAADGSTYRVKRWWHQSVSTGQKPAVFGYGTEYSAINDILAARDDDGSHGTHVGGIAAGSGFSTPQLKYRGMAPNADLVFVTIKYANDSLAGSAYGDYLVANPSILDGYKYIFDYASSVSKPAVCNLSWGMHTGPHDGSSLFDKAVESLTGTGKIVVGAAGNESNNLIHIGAQLNNDTVYTFAIDRSRNDYKHEQVYMDIWGAVGEKIGINISLLDTFGNERIVSPFYYSNGGNTYKKLLVNGQDSVWITLAVNPSFVNNNKPEILAMIESSNAGSQRIRLGVTGKGQFHAWNSGQPYRWTSGGFLNKVRGNDYSASYLNGSSANCVGENGGTGKSTISVGSYVARNSWTDYTNVYRAQNWLNVGEISDFSSRGPTTDNRIKPDISAPGQNIISSVNTRAFAGWMGDATTLKTQFNSQEFNWTMFSGTSMAAPHVAGIVALLLEANPTLTPQQIRDVLQQTAIRDKFTGADSNNNYGYGKVNAMGAIKAAIKLGNQNGVVGSFSVFPNPANGNLQFVIPEFANRVAKIQLYGFTGALVFETEVQVTDMGTATIALNDVNPGIYNLMVQSGASVLSKKLAVMH